ncbi:porin family protein [Lysobacter enzymogenes]|uniref:porin family protein n=1 Tax=Lysobacter enzymogenes TaxID=69 RepID=UPI001AF24A1E|nr:porin family protein [Lysobacter enzymogenes]QQP99645.1 porin family protein [Lysobacter enzymogenes]
MQRTLSALAAAAIAFTLSTAANAQGAGEREGFYAYGGVGAATTQWDAKRSALPAGQKRSQDKGSTSFVLGGGYRFNRYFAVEGSYHDLFGEVSRRGLGDYDTRSLQLSALGILPIGERFEIFGKASVGRARNEFTPVRGAVGLGKASETVNIAALGVGANYHFTDQFALRLDVTGLSKADSAFRRKAGADDIKTGEATLSVMYRF